MKLSAVQLRVLVELDRPGAIAHFCEKRGKRRPTPGWLIPALGYAEINTLDALEKKGLVLIDYLDKTARISCAGRRAITDPRGQDD